MKLLFGSTCFTAEIADTCKEDDLFYKFIQYALHRHQSGDWGDLSPEDNECNEIAVLTGQRIFSSYLLPEELQCYAEKIFIITEADRSVTTVLFPSDY